MDNLVVSSYNNFSVLAHKVNGTINNNSILMYDGKLHISDLQLENPAFILKHPYKCLIYVCYESIYDGHIATLEYNNNNLTLLNEVKSEGKSSCYLEFTPDMKNIININYWDSSITIHPLNNGVIQKASKFYRIPVSNNINHIEEHLKNRQTTSHHHSCVFFENKLYVPDLGKDKIDIYDYVKDELIYNSCFNLKQGSGPRYSVINNQTMYVVNELDSTVTVIDMLQMNIIQIISTIPNNCKKNTCGGIQLVNNYLYISNRGDDSIAVFKILDNNLLEILDIFKTYGNTPRHFKVNIQMTKLYVANQDTNNVVIFNIDNGNLIYETEFVCNSPNYILIL